MARITHLFQRQRINRDLTPPAEQEDIGGSIPDDIKLAIKRCRHQHPDNQTYYECLRVYLIFRGDLEIHDSPEHEFASDMTGGEVS